jgi:hypothetical protein
MKRNEEELHRVERALNDSRAVMVAVLFCRSTRGGREEGQPFVWLLIRHLSLCGPRGSRKQIDRFENLHRAVEPDGSNLRFFDVQDAPKNGRPAQRSTIASSSARSVMRYLQRNQAEFSGLR